MTYPSIYAFERTELRTLQNQCADNEEFLNRLADMVGALNQKVAGARGRDPTENLRVMLP